jgi:hypothetical protein
MLNRLGLNRHVTDADLTAVWADARLGEPTSAAGGHVRECPACRARLTQLSTWLDGLRTDARHEADEAFPRERLVTQQAQIVRRLEAMERPARVLAFPRFTRAISVPHMGRQRWIAAAAVAGLIVGVGLGQTFDLRRTKPDGLAGPASQIARTSTYGDRNGIQPISATPSDEAFLYQEPSLSAERVPESLRSLHEITPSARDYDPR